MSEAQIATLTKEVTELYLAEYVQTWDSFIASLDIPTAEKTRLLALVPGAYTGLAGDMARRI